MQLDRYSIRPVTVGSVHTELYQLMTNVEQSSIEKTQNKVWGLHLLEQDYKMDCDKQLTSQVSAQVGAPPIFILITFTFRDPTLRTSLFDG